MLLTCFLLSLVAKGLAEEPKALANARFIYESELAMAQKQMEADYLAMQRDRLTSHMAVLESYKKDAMQAGKLEEAIAYDKEMKKAEDLYSKQKKKSPSAKQQSAEEAFLEGVWSVDMTDREFSWGIYVFKGKSLKIFRYGKRWHGVHGYTIKDGIVTITWGKDGKGWDKHTIDMKNPNQMHVVNSYGSKAIATRLK